MAEKHLLPTARHSKHGRQFVQGFVRDLRRQQKIDAPLGADTTDAYRSAGFCLVMKRPQP